MKPVLVTGAANGIGLATATLLLADGRAVVGIDRVPLPALGPGFSAVQADLSNPGQITEAAAQAIAVAPDLDGLVN